MTRFARTALAAWLVASFVLASARAQSGAEWVGDRGAMAGELAAMSPYGNSPWVEYPIDWAFGDASVSAEITMRYRLWTLVGEPVWTFEPSYELQWVKFGASSIRPDPRLGAGEVEGDLRPDGSTIIRVSQDVFRSVRIRGLHFSARFAQSAPDRSTVYRNGWATAVFDRPGEWGWDVPGSPRWDETFTTQGDPVADGEEITRWIDRDAAKDLWSRLDTSWKASRAEPLDLLRCYRLDVSVSSLLARLERASPGVTRPLFQRRLRGETTEQAAERNAREYQVQALLNGVARQLERTLGASSKGSTSNDLERRLAVTEKAILLLPEASRSDLVEELEQARTFASEAELERDLETLARDAVAWSSRHPDEPLPEGVREGIARLGAQVQGRSGQLSRATGRRMEALQGLEGLGAGLRVVAEWTGPEAASKAGSSISLWFLHAGEDGRAVAVFHRTSDTGLGITDWDGFDFVDALTGEVLHRREGRAWPAVFGDARWVLDLEAREPGLSGWKCRGAFDLKTRRRVGVPWTGFVRDQDPSTGLVLIQAAQGKSELECWDFDGGQLRWSVGSSHDERASFSQDGWVLMAREGGGRVLDAADGSLYFDTTVEPLRTQTRGSRLSSSQVYTMLGEELVRRVGEPLEAPPEFPALPPEYDPTAERSAWTRSHDAFLVPAPHAAHSDKGGVRYRLLR